MNNANSSIVLQEKQVL